MNVTRSGSCRRLRTAFAARPTATRSRERAGLYTFLELCRDAELLETVPELRFVQTKGAAVA